jgi:hypothetical protein
MSGSWWAKKLTEGRPPPAAPVQSPYAGVLPVGMGQDHQAVLDRYMQRNGINQPAQAPQAPPGQLPVTQVGPNEIAVPQAAAGGVMGADGDPYGYHTRIWGWTGDPRFGAGETNQTGNCPSCGGARFFSRSNAEGAGIGTGGVMNRDGQKVYPTPECFDCGYPRHQGTIGVAPGGLLPGVAPARTVPLQQTIAPDGSLATLIKH